jgi:hypothetical protein
MRGLIKEYGKEDGKGDGLAGTLREWQGTAPNRRQNSPQWSGRLDLVF